MALRRSIVIFGIITLISGIFGPFIQKVSALSEAAQRSIDKLNLKEEKDNLGSTYYKLEGYEGIYIVLDNGSVYYSGDSNGTPPRMWDGAGNIQWKNVTSQDFSNARIQFMQERTAASVSNLDSNDIITPQGKAKIYLEKLGYIKNEDGTYSRPGYTGTYTIDPDGTIRYSGGEGPNGIKVPATTKSPEEVAAALTPPAFTGDSWFSCEKGFYEKLGTVGVLVNVITFGQSGFVTWETYCYAIKAVSFMLGKAACYLIEWFIDPIFGSGYKTCSIENPDRTIPSKYGGDKGDRNSSPSASPSTTASPPTTPTTAPTPSLVLPHHPGRDY